MAIDVLTYTDLLRAERQIQLPENERSNGVFIGGSDRSMLLGDGLEIDGLRDYEPGDEARHIDWIKSASRSDDGLWVRQHYADRAQLTVLISDVVSDRLARTPGQPLAARSLGLVASHLLLKAATREDSPIIGVWSGGTVLPSATVRRPLEGPKAARKAIEHGLAVASAATQQAQATRESANRGLFSRKKNGVATEVTEEHFSDVILAARTRARKFAEAARYIIVSDFRMDTTNVLVAVAELKRYSEVITVEVTNPLLRELPANVSVMETQGSKKNLVIEGGVQRAEYARLAAEKQQRITAGLTRVSDWAVTLDTVNTEGISTLTRFGKK